MIGPSEISSAAEAAASNPKVAMGISALTGALASAASMDIIHGALVNIGLALASVATLYVIRIHAIKYRLLKRQWDKPDGRLPKEDEV